MEKRAFTKEEKLRIIEEVSKYGVKPTLEKYDRYVKPGLIIRELQLCVITN